MAHRRALAAAFLTSLVVAVPGAHAAAWAPVGRIVDPFGAQDTVVERFATDRAGALTVVYRGFNLEDERGPLRIRDRPFRGRLGRPTTFSGAVADAQLAVAPNGRQVLLTTVRHSDGSLTAVTWSRQGAGRAWGSRQVVATGLVDAYAPHAAIASSGEAVVTWRDDLSVVAAARSAGAARFGAPEVLASMVARGTALGMDARGNAVLAWPVIDGGLNVALRPAGGRFGAAQALGLPGRANDFELAPQLAVEPSGHAVLAWPDTRTGTAGGPYGLEAAIGSTTAGFGEARLISRAWAEDVNVSLDDRMTAITWTGGTGSGVKAMGAFGETGQHVSALRVRALGHRRTYTRIGALAVGRGRATMLWDRQVGKRPDGGPLSVVEARTAFDGGRVLTRRQKLSPPGTCCAQLAVSRRGRAYAAWQASRTHIAAARASLTNGLFGPPDRLRAVEPDQIDLIPTRGDAMLLAFRRQAYYLRAYGER